MTLFYKQLVQLVMNILTNSFFSLVSAFKEPVVKLYKVFSSLELFTLGITITGLWTAFRVAFEKSHNISFDLVTSIMWLVLLDTITGFWKHLKLKRLSSEGWGKFVVKVIIYWMFIKLVDKLIVADILEFVGDLMLSGLIVREAISVIENMGVIYPGIIPAWILKKLKDFEDDGEFNSTTGANSNADSMQPTEKTQQNNP
jgi:hypothetical protein